MLTSFKPLTLESWPFLPLSVTIVHGNRIALKAIRTSNVQAEFMNNSVVSLGIRTGDGGNIVVIQY